MTIVFKTGSKSYGMCEQDLMVNGRGVRDTFKAPCFDDSDVVIDNDDITVLGDINNFSFCLFRDTISVLVVIRNQRCVKNIYTTKDGVTSGRPSSPPMTEKECTVVKQKIGEDVKNTIADAIKQSNLANKRVDTDIKESKMAIDFKRISERYGKCEEDIILKGRGVWDSIRGPCIDKFESLINDDDLTIIGDSNHFSFCLFRDTISVLVVIRNERCVKNIYTTKDGVTSGRPSSPPMTEKECLAVKQKIREELKKQKTHWANYATEELKYLNANKLGSSTPTVNKGQTSGVGGSLKFTPAMYDPTMVITNTPLHKTSEMCEIVVIGKGVRDSFKETCESTQIPLSNEGIDLFGNPDTHSFCLFSDKWNNLVVIRNGECTSNTYTTVDKVTTVAPTSPPMSQKKCNDVKRIMVQQLRKNNLYFLSGTRSKPVSGVEGLVTSLILRALKGFGRKLRASFS